ncbi:MAG: lipase, partial [Pseudomonadota bacterium]
MRGWFVRPWTTTLGILRIPGGCDAGPNRRGRAPPHCGATAIPAVKERLMTPPPRHFRPRACLLATALLALSSASLAAAPAAPGDLLSAAPYRASWVPSKAAHAYK